MLRTSRPFIMISTRNENAAILTKFLLMAAPKVVTMTTFSTTSDETFIKMTFAFRCIWLRCPLKTSIKLTSVQHISGNTFWTCSHFLNTVTPLNIYNKGVVKVIKMCCLKCFSKCFYLMVFSKVQRQDMIWYIISSIPQRHSCEGISVIGV